MILLHRYESIFQVDGFFRHNVNNGSISEEMTFQTNDDVRKTNNTSANISHDFNFKDGTTDDALYAGIKAWELNL